MLAKTASNQTINVPRVGFMANCGGASSEPYRHVVARLPQEEVQPCRIVAILARLLSAAEGYERGVYDDVGRDWAEANGLIAPEYFYMSTDVAQYLVWVVTPEGQYWLAENKDAVRAYYAPRIAQAQQELDRMQAACA